MTLRAQNPLPAETGQEASLPASGMGPRSGEAPDRLAESPAVGRAALDLRHMTPEAYERLSQRDALRPLAAILHGDAQGEAAAAGKGWPEVRSHLRTLEVPGRVEVLLTDSAVAREREQGFELASSEAFLFGACRVEDIRGARVAEAAEAVYLGLLRLIERRGYPRLLRMWNILEDINGQEEGLERYRHFCLGRHEALAVLQPATLEAPPAACGIGAEDGGLCVYFLAAREPGLPVENPRQVSAYRYPPRYGPRSPSFSRGLFKRLGDRAGLFLSGTASITGHESRHLGCVAAQVGETLENVRALVRAAEERSGQALPLASPDTTLRAYVRDEGDYPLVRELLERHLGPEAEVLYLRADICRRELLFEIDGQIFQPATGA